MSTSLRYIGLMSGTSMDGIDAALLEITPTSYQLKETLSHHISNELQQEVAALCQLGDNEIERMGSADHLLGHEFALATNKLLNLAELKPKDIQAIGSHGQTIRHQPLTKSPFTLQIGDPNIISQQTGICTVADFRRRDMASGGQGAPLAPAFHQASFGSSTSNRAVINIGGMANITFLRKGVAELGFDTGPGNVLMDYWIKKHHNKPFDHNGEWASKGTILPSLLEQLLAEPYLALPAPKSTGRELFNGPWLEQQLQHSSHKAADIQTTLLTFTVLSIANEVKRIPHVIDEVFICGGGAYNEQLMQALQTELPKASVASTDKLGIAAEWVEAAAFAWLAHQTLSGLNGNIPAVTGAQSGCILGAIYPA